MVKEKKGTITKKVIKIEINSMVIKNLSRTMMMIGIKWKKKTENVNIKTNKIQTAMKNK
jgi:hypothetical protein